MRSRMLRDRKLSLDAFLRWSTLAIVLLGSGPVGGQEPISKRSDEVPWEQRTARGKAKAQPTREAAEEAPEDETEASEEAAARVANLPRRDESGGRYPADAAAQADPEATPEAAGVPDVDDSKWWQKDPEKQIANPESGLHGRGVSPRGEIIQSSQIVAMVGTEPILAGDLLGRINEMLEPHAKNATEEQLDQQRWLLLEKLLPSAIESKLVYLDFTRGMEKDKLSSIRTNVYKQFDQKQLPRLIEQAKLETATDLEERLRSLGTSLENTRRSFYEQVTAREMVLREGEDDQEVTHDQLLEYYQEHADVYLTPARVRWEQLSVRFDRHPSKREAYRAIAEMGNAVLNGARLDEVAKRESQGPTAKDGGLYDWTVKGSLVSTVLDESLFQMPLEELSDILEDEIGFHIIRVLEREEVGKVPFTKAQVEIRDKIKEQRQEEKVKTYLERLKRETYVWNYFEEKSRGG